jgi:hypothetical protein
MITQTEFAPYPASLSQCDKILAALRDARGQWVAMPDLVMASASFNIHSRVSDLRKRGHVIEQEGKSEGRKVKSFYRLLG